MTLDVARRLRKKAPVGEPTPLRAVSSRQSLQNRYCNLTPPPCSAPAAAQLYQDGGLCATIETDNQYEAKLPKLRK
jgi:hypothetical protein